MLTPFLRTLACFSTVAIALGWSVPSYAQGSKLIQNMDVNKDGKISRDEIPEGSATRRMFDNMVQKFSLDAKKTYTIAEFEQATEMAPSVPSTSSSSQGSSNSRFGSPRRSFPGTGPSFGPTSTGRNGSPSRAPSDGRPFRPLQEVPDPYRGFDKDGDGQIGLYEWPRDRIREFIALDTNDDGFLTINELKKSSNGTSGSKEAPKEKKDETKSDDVTTSTEESTH